MGLQLMMTQVCLSFSAYLSHSTKDFQVIEYFLSMIEFRRAFFCNFFFSIITIKLK